MKGSAYLSTARRVSWHRPGGPEAPGKPERQDWNVLGLAPAMFVDEKSGVCSGCLQKTFIPIGADALRRIKVPILASWR